MLHFKTNPKYNRMLSGAARQESGCTHVDLLATEPLGKVSPRVRKRYQETPARQDSGYTHVTCWPLSHWGKSVHELERDTRRLSYETHPLQEIFPWLFWFCARITWLVGTDPYRHPSPDTSLRLPRAPGHWAW